ncbi:hypothetical protein V9K67_20770 [Paraflavisolibacter sp. H34]|uniref:hypothetical protein n=1 Tax=Huijunlia imazamoxiresistens TaxID=3127457 RepID=UPI003016B21B
MKIMIWAVPVTLLFSCAGRNASDAVQEFIPGTYVRYYTDEFRKSFDTVQIRPVTSSGSTGYAITKRDRYRKVLDGRELPEQSSVKEWMGAYDPQTQTLLLESSGSRIYFDPSKGELNMGKVPYKKL